MSSPLSRFPTQNNHPTSLRLSSNPINQLDQVNQHLHTTFCISTPHSLISFFLCIIIFSLPRHVSFGPSQIKNKTRAEPIHFECLECVIVFVPGYFHPVQFLLGLLASLAALVV